MVYALQADDPLKADSLLLAGVSANSEYTNYTFLYMPPGSSLLHWAAAYDSLQCVKVRVSVKKEQAFADAAVAELPVSAVEDSAAGEGRTRSAE